MPTSTEVKKRRVLARDHTHIAQYIHEELKRRKNSRFRKRHELIWEEVDRQIAMEPPQTLQEDDGDWHNAIQLGDLTDASETITADVMRMVFPSERKFFQPHIELPTEIDPETGDPQPVDPQEQRTADGVLRNLMVQQQRDFGYRNRTKLGIKEILHHGGVVATVEWEKMPRYQDGTKVDHLSAPGLKVYSMWNCYPDPSPTVFGTELFYRGSMIITSFWKLQDALEHPRWINKDKLKEANDRDGKKLSDHIEVVTYYGDVFLKRHDGNVLFPNRTTVVSGEVFLESTVNPTPYSNVIYTGYERDDVRDPYYTSPIIKRAPMGKFATHMANRTMDSIDLKVKPPINYDTLDNSMRGEGPEIYPGAKLGSRGGLNIKALDVGDPAMGLAALQFAKESLQEGTMVDAVRKGVSPSTEQTATEIVKTEQRAEVRLVEFVSTVDAELILPFLYMQHDLNKRKLEPYPFYNDEPHTPDFLRAKKSDLPKAVNFEVTGSRTILGETERAQRFATTVATVAQLPPLVQMTDWAEVNRQFWEDTKVKDPERFQMNTSRNDDIRLALEQQAQQFQAQMQEIQQQMQQLGERAQNAEVEAQKAQLQVQQAQVQHQEAQARLRLTEHRERAEDQLEKIQKDIDTKIMSLEFGEKQEKLEAARNQRVASVVTAIKALQPDGTPSGNNGSSSAGGGGTSTPPAGS